MSRASAQFFFDDGDQAHGIYCGTSDIMQVPMFRSQKEPWDWFYARRGTNEFDIKQWPDFYAVASACEKAHKGEHVLVYSDYGSGTYWHGTACRECMVFLGPYEYGYGQAAQSEDDYVPYFKDEAQARAATPRLPA